MEFPEAAGNLESSVRRRWWLFRTLVEQMEPEAALALAERMRSSLFGGPALLGDDDRRGQEPADERFEPPTGSLAETTSALTPASSDRLPGKAQLCGLIDIVALGAAATGRNASSRRRGRRSACA
jgi:hypothetical protein